MKQSTHQLVEILQQMPQRTRVELIVGINNLIFVNVDDELLFISDGGAVMEGLSGCEIPIDDVINKVKVCGEDFTFNPSTGCYLKIQSDILQLLDCVAGVELCCQSNAEMAALVSALWGELLNDGEYQDY